MLQPAPYPADTRAKGWRFELDHERIAQSSTWAVAGTEGRPWLLMLWMTAWQQVPCGSLPEDEEIIAALIGCPPKTWAKLRKSLLRGWAEADDGRLYHATITIRVREMVEQRSKTAKRVADYKVKAREQRGANALPPREPLGKNDTGTGTGTGTIEDLNTHTPLPITNAGRVCFLMRQAGIAEANPGHPTLMALLDAGCTDAEFIGAATVAFERGKGFAYAIGTLKRQREEAATAVLHVGKMPATETPYARQMREKYESIVPSVAAKRPGIVVPFTVEMEAPNVARIVG